MEITFADENDKAAVQAIWQCCFGDGAEYMHAYFTHVYKAENTIVARICGVPVAALQMLPYTLVNGKTALRAIYIGGVSVMPDYRRQGIASRLLDRAEDIMRKNGVDVSFLVPFSFLFYQKYGYRCISYLSDFTGDISALAPFVLTDESLYKTGSPPIDIYFTFANRFSLYIKRTERNYRQEILPLCHDAHCYILNENDGYILFTIEKNVLHVLEIAYKDKCSLRKILGFIYEKRNEVKKFRICAAANGDVRKVLCENTISETRYPHAMAKVLTDAVLPDSMQTYINMLGWF